MEKLREKGKDGEYVSDGTVRGLKYEKQGDGIYARLLDEQGHRQA